MVLSNEEMKRVEAFLKSVDGDNSLSGRERLKRYFEMYPGVRLSTYELREIAGIADYARTIRKLRVGGLNILSARSDSSLGESEYLYEPTVRAEEESGTVLGRIAPLGLQREQAPERQETN